MQFDFCLNPTVILQSTTVLVTAIVMSDTIRDVGTSLSKSLSVDLGVIRVVCAILVILILLKSFDCNTKRQEILPAANVPDSDPESENAMSENVSSQLFLGY